MIDKYPLSDDEKTELRDMAARIVDLPEFDLPAADGAHDSISAESWRTINELDAIFWERLPMMAIYKLVEEVNPIGGREKAAALEDIAAREGSALENIIYFGDSITDTEAFRLLNQNGGLSVSFNGNHWAVQEARLAITAQSALPMLWIASTFIRYGPRALEDLMIIEPGPENIHQVRRISSEIRKRVRTEVIGALG
jgi:energy-converting hydrogenase A subunit R